MAGSGDTKDRVGLVPALLLALALLLCYALTVAVLTPVRYDVAPGAPAAQTVEAPRTLENKAATKELRDAARAATKSVYRLDQSLIDSYTAGAEAFFADAASMRSQAETLRQARQMTAGVPASGTLTPQQWQQVVTSGELAQFLAKIGVALTADEGWQLLSAREADFSRLQDAVLLKLTASLRSGLEERSLLAVKTAYLEELNALTIPDALKGIGKKVLDAYLKPTFVVDEAATAQAQEAAASAVEPVQIRRGEAIVRKDDVVTEQQYELLSELDLVKTAHSNAGLDFGVALYLVCLFGTFAAFLFLHRRRVAASRKSMLILTAAMGIAMLLALAFNALDPRITTGLAGVLMIALLLDSTTAAAANVLLAFSLALLAGGRGEAPLGFDTMVMAVSMLVGGQVAIFFLRGYQKRGSIIAAGACAGAASALVIAAAYIMTEHTAVDTLIAAGWSIGISVFSAIFVVGTLSVWENLFGVATGARLAELSNANHPLLRQLMTEAPGTYHHSMMTAALAESAAEAVDADPLLARVGAYYHDVGKLRRPLYFMENQRPGENIHDTLPAAESATIIIAHQRDSVLMLNKHKMPASVVQIAFEHHGNTLVAYFYRKAAKENGGKPPAQKNFRYPGARPSTKESAIVLLADSCEAAVRALDNPTREEVEETVERVIKGKMDDGQLSASPLNFREITLIGQSFLRTFNGLLHERIAYPEPEQGDKP